MKNYEESMALEAALGLEPAETRDICVETYMVQMRDGVKLYTEH